jgi:hypothetical protein
MRIPRLPNPFRRAAALVPPRPLVLVDGSNVRRSTWPNPGEDDVVRALDAWSADSAPHDEVVIVFDGRPAAESTDRVEVVPVRYADDDIVARVREAAAAGRSVRVATSDRELRSRIEAEGGVVAWGGGRFLGELGLRRRTR